MNVHVRDYDGKRRKQDILEWRDDNRQERFVRQSQEIHRRLQWVDAGNAAITSLGVRQTRDLDTPGFPNRVPPGTTVRSPASAREALCKTWRPPAKYTTKADEGNSSMNLDRGMQLLHHYY